MAKTATAEELASFVPDARDHVQEGDTVVVQVGGSRVVLDEQLAQVVLGLLESAAAGSPIEVSTLPAELTTGQAADVLGVSRPTVVKLIDAGQLPATRVGTHRRLATADVLAYKERVTTQRAAAMREIIDLSQDLDDR